VLARSPDLASSSSGRGTRRPHSCSCPIYWAILLDESSNYDYICVEVATDFSLRLYTSRKLPIPKIFFYVALGFMPDETHFLQHPQTSLRVPPLPSGVAHEETKRRPCPTLRGLAPDPLIGKGSHYEIRKLPFR
jgi:hypothetical protein